MTVAAALPRPVAFWLVPAPTAHARLRATIERLANEVSAPAIEPHVTLHVGRGARHDIETLLSETAASLAPFELTAASTGHGGDRFKSLFVTFREDPRPHLLHHALRAAMTAPADYVLQPHLSLLYKVLPEATRVQLADTNSIDGESIAFDHIAAVRPAGLDDNWDNIPGLDVWLRAPLRGR